MIKYPIGIQDFRKLRTEGFIYIDKTKDIFQLIGEGDYYFLSRPRRFGKSLLLSTLKYLFQGERELFQGLWIADRHDWQPHPVLHFSFSTLGYKEIGLEAGLHQALNQKATAAGITLSRKGLGPRFEELIQQLSKKKNRVVILIDEYDKPLVDYIDQPGKAAENRDTLKNFFSVLKDADAYLRFFLITGVSKFSKVSLFSDLNNLEDITLAPVAATLTGYTQAELEHYFVDPIGQLAQVQDMEDTDLLAKVRRWYNGYRWSGTERLYNPFSILNLLKQQRFANFWWETGTPTFLIKKLRSEFRYDLDKLEASQVVFESFTLDNLNWLALLFQTGYLTIIDYDADYRLYTLGYPNLEVKDTMHQHLLAAYRETANTDSLPLLIKIKKALEKGDIEYTIELINLLFATIPYQLYQQKREALFHAVLHLTFSGIGLYTQSEVSTAKGRVDTLVHTEDRIYVIEFKLDASAESALAQIRERRYGNAFMGQDKEVIALGIRFDSTEKEITEWRAVPYRALLQEEM